MVRIDYFKQHSHEFERLKKEMKNKNSIQPQKAEILFDSSDEDAFLSEIRLIIDTARNRAYAAINTAMVEAYWLIGKRIIEQEQKGEDRAEYGRYLIKELSKQLTKEYGRGFSVTNLKSFRLFFLTFSPPISVLPNKPLSKAKKSPGLAQKGQTVSALLTKDIPCLGMLSWSHYERIMRVANETARLWYLHEAAENHWSIRTLDRNISTQYYERLLKSQIKEPVIQEMLEKTFDYQQDKFEFIKNPAVLEFLNLPNNLGYTEGILEKAIIDNLQRFILELGKGYAFVERQKLIRTEARNYFIDLVFYNFILKCFVLIDLKTERITHQDVGQMDMYVRMYDETVCSEDDNPTIGIVLCSDTDEDIARYSILKGNEQIFATKYKLYLPAEDDLRIEIERQKQLIRMQLEKEE